MIRYIYKTTKSNTLKELDEYKPGVWINVEDPSHEELDELATKHELDLGVLRDVLDEDEMPRLERDGDTNYLFTRFVFEEEGISASTEVALFVISEDLLITISVKPMPSVAKILEKEDRVVTTQRTKLFLQLLNLEIDGYETQLNKISKQIKAIRQRLKVQEVKNQDFINFVTIEDELNEFLTVLMPTSSILRRLLIGKHVVLFDEDEDIVEDLMLNSEQSIAESKAILRTIVNIREAYSTITTNNLNRVIRVLTVITTVLAIPTLIASLYGMNVNLPGSGDSEAFTIIVLTSVLISLCTLLFFRWKKWL